MVPNLKQGALYGLQNNRNGSYLRSYRNKLGKEFEIGVSEPEKGVRVHEFGFILHIHQSHPLTISMEAMNGGGSVTWIDKQDGDSLITFTVAPKKRPEARWRVEDGDNESDSIDDSYLLKVVNGPNNSDSGYLEFTSTRYLTFSFGRTVERNPGDPGLNWRFVHLHDDPGNMLLHPDKMFNKLRNKQLEYDGIDKEDI